MDLLGDIVEKEVDAPEAPTFPPMGPVYGFPKPKLQSSWKTRRQNKKKAEDIKPVPTTKDGFQVDESTGLKRLPKEEQKLNYDNLTEAEKIHLENIEILNGMSEEQRLREKEELLGSMDPRVLQKLLLRSERKLSKRKDLPDFEGYGDWIGGDREGNNTWEEPTMDVNAVNEALGIKSAMKKLNISDDLDHEEKKVTFDTEATVQYAKEKQDEEWEDVVDIDEIAPPSYQINQEASELPLEEAFANVHFLKPVDKEDMKLDINDPDFNEKLHQKYFPDLPRDTKNLEWMEPLPEVDTSNMIFDDVSDLRFDFKGDLIIPAKNNEIDTSKGLHHHAENPALAGYTLAELAHLSRSTVPGQRCIAIRSLGRILHKLGKGVYLKNLRPEFITDDGEEVPEEIQVDQDAIKSANTEFDQMFWGLIDELRIIETLEEAADETVTTNISVRNYAIEALWLWKQGGGNKRHAN